VLSVRRANRAATLGSSSIVGIVGWFDVLNTGGGTGVSGSSAGSTFRPGYAPRHLTRERRRGMGRGWGGREEEWRIWEISTGQVQRRWGMGRQGDEGNRGSAKRVSGSACGRVGGESAEG
jgi:hypothetical protein